MNPNPKFLIIRFSSIGDVTESLSIPAKIKEKFQNAEIHWVTRMDLAQLIESHPQISRVWKLNKKDGFWGLLKMIYLLRKQKFTHIYDAHNNTRSLLITSILRLNIFVKHIRKSQFRFKRILLFQFRINLYRMPFSGQRDLLTPLKKWGITETLPPTPQFFIPENFKLSIELPEKFIALVPSAAFSLKRWPLENWMALIRMHPDKKFVLLGGPEDSFLQNLQDQHPDRVINLSQKLSLLESSAVIQKSTLVISNDTGLLHIAEQLGKNAIALMGPAPFGYPSRSTTQILELHLGCKPCSKHGQGPCVNAEYHKCLRDITPIWVSESIQKVWNS